MVTLRHSGNFEAALQGIADKIDKKALLRAGFLEKATYPDGTKVAMVAAIQEFGAPRARIPPRPFFRPMIAEKAKEWGPVLADQLRSNGMNVVAALSVLGEGIAGQIRASILKVQSPPLSKVTLMLRKMKSEDQTLRVTRRTVWEAIRRVQAGESTGGVPTKPLIDWPVGGHMLSSTDYEVKT